MTAGGEDTDQFDEEIIASTADEYELDEGSLGDVIRRHQESIAALPGIENLAYEWRKQYESPLVERTPAAYYFAVPEWVWGEFGDALDVGDEMLDALVEVHRQTVVDRTDVKSEPSEKVTYVVLDRSFDETSPER